MRDEEIKEIDNDEFFEQIEEETLDDDMETSGAGPDDEPAVLEEKPEVKKETEAVPAKKRNNNHKKHKEETKVQHKKSEHNSEKKGKSPESHMHAKKNKTNVWLWVIGAVVIMVLIGLAVYFNNFVNPKGVTLKGNVLANVNGEDITELELETQYNRLPPQTKMFITKENLLEQMIDEKLLIQDAKKKGITISDDNVNEFLRQTVTDAGLTMDQFQTGIEEKNITLDEVKAFFKNQLIVTDLLNQTILQKIEVTDKEISDYYEQNKANYNVGETVLASHILVNSTEEAKKILDMIKEGKDFGELAAQYSLDPSAKQYNGSLGWFVKGDMVKEFEDAVFAMEIGDVAGPVKTSFGYHIIKVFDKKTAQQLTLDAVSEQVKKEVTFNKQKDMYATYIKDLRAAAKIVRKVATTSNTTITDTTTTETLTKEATLAKCLTEKGAKLYTASWCGNCKTQKELFGDAITYLNQVECANPDNSITKDCSDAGVKAVPTWFIGEKMVPGKKELSELAKLAGCKY